MGMFDDFVQETKQRESGDGTWFQPGTYEVRLVEAKYKETTRRTGFPCAIFACQILSSDNPALPSSKTATHVVSQRGPDRGYFYGELLDILSALCGLHHVEDRQEVEEKIKPRAGDLLEKAFTAGAFNGVQARIVVTEKPLDKGGLFTLHEWLPHTRGKMVRG